MFKLLKIVIKQLLCHHRYQPYGYASFVSNKNEPFDTWYIFKCKKCNHEKIFKTYDKDLIIGAKKATVGNKKEGD